MENAYSGLFLLLSLGVSFLTIVIVFNIIMDKFKSIKETVATPANNNQPTLQDQLQPVANQESEVIPRHVFDQCGYYVVVDELVDTQVQKRVNCQGETVKQTIDKQKVQKKTYPERVEINKDRIYIAWAISKNRTLKRQQDSVNLFGQRLKDLNIIPTNELEIINEGDAHEWIFLILTEERKRARDEEQFLIKNHLYDESDFNGKAIRYYPTITRDPKTNNILLNAKNYNISTERVLKSVPAFELRFSDTFDKNKVKNYNDENGDLIHVIRKTNPVSNLLGFKKIIKEAVNPETGVIEKKQVIEPETIFDQYDKWKQHVQKSFDTVKFEYRPQIFLGKNQYDNGEKEEFFISTVEEAHMLIGGTPGGGKTQTAQSIFGVYILTSQAHFRFFDGKGATTWQSLANRVSKFDLGVPVARDNTPKLYELYFLIKDLYEVMQERINTLKQVKGADNYVAYNRLLKEYKIQPEGILIDEWGLIYPDFISGDSDNSFKTPTVGSPAYMLLNILKMGRSVGCQVVIITQNVKDNEVPNDLKNLLPIKLIHKSDKTTGTYLQITHPVDNLDKGCFIFKAQESEVLLKNHYIGPDWDRFVDTLPQREDRVPFHYDEIFIASDDYGKNITSMSLLIKKYLRKEGFEVVKFYDDPVSKSKPDEAGFFIDVKGKLFNRPARIVFIYFTIDETKSFEKIANNYVSHPADYYIVLAGKPCYKEWMAATDPDLISSIVNRSNTIMLMPSQWQESLSKIRHAAETTIESTPEKFTDRYYTNPFATTLETFLNETNNDGLTDEDIFDKPTSSKSYELTEEEKEQAYQKIKANNSKRNLEPKIIEDNSSKKSYSKDERLKILATQLAKNLSDSKACQEFELANGLIGKWKRDLSEKDKETLEELAREIKETLNTSNTAKIEKAEKKVIFIDPETYIEKYSETQIISHLNQYEVYKSKLKQSDLEDHLGIPRGWFNKWQTDYEGKYNKID